MTAQPHSSEIIERELAALGEAPPSPEELAMLAGADDLDDDLDDEPEIASVARLAELAEPLAFEDLSQLETHRAWRSVEQRLARSGHDGPANDAGRSGPSGPSPHGGGPRRWLFAAAGLAAAAALAWIIVGPSPEQPELDAATVAKLGEQARATLKALDDGASDTQRAEQRAAEYQQRLQEQGG